MRVAFSWQVACFIPIEKKSAEIHSWKSEVSAKMRLFFMIFCMAALVSAGKKKKNESNSLDQETNKKTKSKKK